MSTPSFLRRGLGRIRFLSRAALSVAVGVSAVGLASMPAGAQTKPTVRVLVGFPPGAGTDTLARIYAEFLGETMNVTAIVENKPGAGGLLANQALAHAAPETNSVMMTIDHQVVMVPLITKNPGFDVRKDLVPVAKVMSFNTCLAVPGSSPYKSLAEWIAAVKADPGRGFYGVPAPGSQAQFVGFVAARHFDVKLTATPYKGAAPAINDVLGAQVPSVIVPCDALTEHYKAGKVRILAAAAEKRLPAMPEVQTFAELGVKMPTENFVAVYAAPSMRPDMLQRITDSTRDMFRTPRMVEKFNSTGMVAAYAGPDELRRIWETDSAFWAEQVRASNFQAQ